MFKFLQCVQVSTVCSKGILHHLDGVLARITVSEANPCNCCRNTQGNICISCSHMSIYGLLMQQSVFKDSYIIWITLYTRRESTNVTVVNISELLYLYNHL
jgi:hypothetical protein